MTRKVWVSPGEWLFIVKQSGKAETCKYVEQNEAELYLQVEGVSVRDAFAPTRPGRTFLGKRRYFSGIAALTPLTPLTYKQNAVNAFIPTKKRR